MKWAGGPDELGVSVGKIEMGEADHDTTCYFEADDWKAAAVAQNQHSFVSGRDYDGELIEAVVLEVHMVRGIEQPPRLMEAGEVIGLLRYFHPHLGEVKGAFGSARQAETQEGLVLERGADLKFQAVFLPFSGEWNGVFLCDDARAVGR